MATKEERRDVNSVDPPADYLPMSSSKRRWIGVAIVAFLLVQVAIPVSYYFKSEPTSERFSWRMFSSVDLSTWSTKVTALVDNGGEMIEREVPVNGLLQESYVKAIQRAQFDIVEPFMRRLSEEQGVKEIRFVAQGKFPSGKLMDPIELSLKPGGELVGK